MPLRPLPICIAATLTLGGPGPAAAQPVTLPPLTAPAAQPAPVPPPSRVGRIAAVTGPVTFHLANATEWQVATPNLPVTNGTALWIAPSGEAAIGIGDGNRVVLAPSTEFDLDRLDDQALAATQAQGESYLHLRTVEPGDTYIVQTPRGVVTIATPGRYGIVSGDTEHPTAITVLDGAATLSGIPATAGIAPNQTLTITGDGTATPFTPSLAPATQDAFLRHALAAERPPAPRPTRAPAIVARMTGADALDEVGEWSETPEYGPVWYPPTANYVPYRQGKWAYVAPWGWTWVDDAPWGFAPTHYGRWSQVDGRWGWMPGRDWAPDRRPAYAPALVGFLGGAALGYGRGPAIGWAPLGPHDAYRPPYQVNDRIAQILNQPTGATTRLNAPVTLDRSAITIVSTQVLTTSAGVAGALRPGPLPPSIGPTSVLQFRPQADPTRATIGATPNLLRDVNPSGLTGPATHAGPGPALAQPPAPQIGPASLLGGAALGAVAGGLLRQPPPRNAALPDLRPRSAPPPGIGSNVQPAPRPLPPATPAFARPLAPRPPDLLGGAPTPGGHDILAGPRPSPIQTQQREPAYPSHREQFAPLRQDAYPGTRREAFPPPRHEQQFAPPRQEAYPAPQREAFPPSRQEQHLAPPRPQQFVPPRQEPVAAPNRPQPPPMPHPVYAPAPPSQHAPAPPQQPRRDGRPDRP